MRQVFPNVVSMDDQRILTPNFAPGQRVYDEELHTLGGVEYRTWNPSKSKLGAFIVKGGRNFPIREDSRVLYLGAANGTTPSHVSDILTRGVLYAVEFSPRSFRDLLGVAGPRTNMVPLLADAWRPELYERFVGKVDVLFQDIAQRQQAAIFAKNLARFKPAWSILAVKARSVDVAKDPRDVYREVAEELEATTEYEVVEMVDLGPFEKDHAALVLRPRTGGSKRAEPVRAQERAPARDERPQRGFDRGPAPRGDRPRFDSRGPPPRGDKPRFDSRPPPPRGDKPRFERRDDTRGDKPRFERRDDTRGDDDRPSGPSKFDGRRYDKRARDGRR